MVPQPELIDRLSSKVRDFQSTHFALRDDLLKLLQVQHAQAPEAVILYSSRVLEALAAHALERLELPSSPNVFSNLELLQQLDLFTPSLFSWAHTLRRLGNEVRHLHCVVTAEDAILACLLLERWLEWYFCSFPLGPQVASLTHDGSGLGLAGPSPLPRLLQAFDAPTFDLHSLVPQLQTDPHLLTLRCTAIFSLVIEMLLDRQEDELAGGVLTTALERFPHDLRLHQLHGLWHSRGYRLPEALACLEPLFVRAPDDGETRGILAGVLKRHWWRNSTETDLLQRAHGLYRTGWERSRKTNAYLGVNAATTALWLGDRTRSRQLAETVRAFLHQRERVVTRLSIHRDPLSNYWQSVSLAEVEVLLGNYDMASDRYRAIFARHPERTKNHEVARDQLGRILGALCEPDDVDAFLKVGGI